MPQKLVWTDARDACLRRLRAEGASWEIIAATLGVGYTATVSRGLRIGARKPPPDHVPLPPDIDPDPDRAPLPPGHRLSWGALVEGTCLAGEPYPPRVSGEA